MAKKLKFKVGDRVYFQCEVWSYKKNCMVYTKEKAVVANHITDGPTNWGCLNVKLIPFKKKFAGPSGSMWTTDTRILEVYRESK